MQHNNYIGVDIGGTNITAGRIVNNVIVRKCRRKTGANRPTSDIIATLNDVIKDVWVKEVIGIGIGVPGFLDVDSGEIIHINNIPSFSGINLADAVTSIYNIPVFVNNDANCFVLGEKNFGVGKEYRNVVGITLGTGLGGGIVINEKIASGIFGGAGEFGCIPYLDGNFEDYCSAKFFESRYNISGAELCKKADMNDKSAKDIFQEFGWHLGSLIRRIVYFIAPEAIIIGGSISKAFDHFKLGIQQALADLPEHHYRQNIKVVRAELNDASLMGAASLAINHFSKRENQIESII